MQIEIPTSTIDCLNASGDQWSKGQGPRFEISSPYTNRVIGVGHETTAEDLEKILAAAKSAQPGWGATPMKERAQILFRFRELLLRDQAAISHRIASECGKTHGEGVAEISKGIEVVEFALSLQNLDSGGKMEVSRGVTCEYRREPLGLVAAITPFNFPAMVPLWMIPIALALGNAFIWKPSDKTPLTSLWIAQLLQEAGLPSGIFNVAQGGKKTVELILDHPDIQAIGFVGSTSVAREIYRRGSQNLKRVLALGGAKNHIIMMPDADLELSGKGIADSFTGCAGQRCMAASVLLAVASSPQEEEKISQLIQKIKEQAQATTVPDRMGAIISKESLQRLELAIAQAQKDGAQILLDGRNPKLGGAANTALLANGNWLAPTILDQVRPGTQAAIEELFGPVLSIIRCRSLKEALQVQKSSPYGNAISVFTQNGGVADEMARLGQAGMVGINVGVPVPREPFSFGGIHESKYGHGDITGVHSLNFWSHVKKITTKWAPQKDTTWMG